MSLLHSRCFPWVCSKKVMTGPSEPVTPDYYPRRDVRRERTCGHSCFGPTQCHFVDTGVRCLVGGSQTHTRTPLRAQDRAGFVPVYVVRVCWFGILCACPFGHLLLKVSWFFTYINVQDCTSAYRCVQSGLTKHEKIFVNHKDSLVFRKAIFAMTKEKFVRSKTGDLLHDISCNPLRGS